MEQEPALSTSMGTDGGRSAFATVRGKIYAPESPSASSLGSSEDVLGYNGNSFLAVSDNSGTLPIAPKSVVELGSDSVSVRLEKGENVVVVGLYSLWVKHGEVSLLGASLQASATLHHVSVPVMHSIPSITAISALAEVVISTDDNGIRYLGDVARHFSAIWEPTFLGTMMSFHVLGYHSKNIKDVSKELRGLTLEHWLPPIRQILRGGRNTIPRVLVTGAKGTGKSTLCRVFINTLLTMSIPGSTVPTKAFPDGVLFLDIDPGQPELSAPGIIYLAHVHVPLLGPSFTNLVIPDSTENIMLRMHYLGAYTPRESPSHYQDCVSDLLRLYRGYPNFPLIINTCGWNTGAGKHVLLSTVREIVLTDIIYIGDTRNATLQELMESDAGGEHKALTPLLAEANRTPLKSGKDFREMQLQAYLHALGVVNGRVLFDQIPLTTIRDGLPANAGVSYKLSMIVMLDQSVKPEYLVTAVDGSVAAIVVIKHGSPLYGLAAGAHTPNGQVPYLVYGNKVANPLDPETTECIGLGYVTAPISEHRQLRIKSPVSAAHITSQAEKGYKIALVLAQQQGLWANLESIQACEKRPYRLQSRRRETTIGGEGECAESLPASTEALAEPGREGFFDELEKAGKHKV
ncbi:hypothetical protein EPUS_06378 [Endocarpon pusillum Z07020]|uniref:Polynucleotide 5'-hydroxyl-kinase GRC3 n=1 Tax=Endocarpon pusillum (strain Z07020 / HMAS-L-300199) TaxID=1263415 RepID=U1HXF0_ENDPU|nr:uncharacterized protein EPUS_06378 [Endocarpon pusillum Z07020]ERF74109.1 hypothetical protein EPUS_06378 [Endocarpon pusillum Z07020]